MMLDIAEILDPLLNDRHKRWEEGLLDDDDESIADITLQLVFFDGEEAFYKWTDTDSIYGARSVVQLSKRNAYEPHDFQTPGPQMGHYLPIYPYEKTTPRFSRNGNFFNRAFDSP